MTNYPPRAASASNGLACPFGRRTYGKKSSAPRTPISRTKPASWRCRRFDTPAASQYAATTPELLRWFDGYNEHQPSGHSVFPFGFLLSLQAKSRIEMAKDEPDALSHELWRRREPRPAAPYFKKPSEAKDHAFDRERGDAIPASWLKSHARSLVRYHLHPETKFQGGEYDQRGPLKRRHVFALGPAIDRQGSRQHRGKRIHRRRCRSAPLWRRAD